MNKSLSEFNFLKKLNVNVFALEKMPKISRAQSMDMLSSQVTFQAIKL